MKDPDREIPKVKPTHNEQTVEIWHADGPIYLTPADARKFADQLMVQAGVIDKRDRPPCPAPYFVDQQPEEYFADAHPCEGARVGQMLCGGGVGGFEFYLEHFVSLHKWLSDILDYHRACGCANLKKLEAKSGDNKTQRATKANASRVGDQRATS